MDEFNDMLRIANDMQQIVGGLMIVSVIPMLLTCFFGYKLQKFLVTLGGIGIGAGLGMVLGMLSKRESTTLVAVVLLSILCGFLAFKLYRLGIFMLYWLLGTGIFAALMIAAGAYDAMGFAAILGLVVGVLALVLHKGFIIFTTALSGGMVSGVSIAEAMGVSKAGVIIGAILSIVGAIVQFSMEKKTRGGEKADDKGGLWASRGDGQAVNGDGHDRSDGEAAVTVPEEKTTDIELLRAAPDSYCPKSKLLIDTVRLSRDDRNNTYISLALQNIGDETIIGIFYKVIGYNIAGEYLGEQGYSIIDLSIVPGGKFESAKTQLFDNSIRKADIVLTKLVDSHQKVIQLDAGDTVALPKAGRIKDAIGEDIEELMGLKPDEEYFYTDLDEGLWICTCGHIGYHKCSYCGREIYQSLRNTDADVAKRVTDHIDALLQAADRGKTLNELAGCATELEQAVKCLEKTGFHRELLDRCKSALERLETRREEIRLDQEKKKTVAKKGLRLAVICAGTVAALGLGIRFVTGLPPSEGKVKAAMTAYLNETFVGEYTIQSMDISPLKERSDYFVEVAVTAQNRENQDTLCVAAYADYVKKDGKYTDPVITIENGYTVYPGHDIGEGDSFGYPRVTLVYDDESYVGSSLSINEDNVNELMAAGKVAIETDMDYSNARLEGNTAYIPVTLTVESQNAGGVDTFEVEYIYDGDYSWRVDSAQRDILLKPYEDARLDKELIQRLVSKSSIRYGEEDLPGEYVSMDHFDVVYTDGFAKARLESGITWDNAAVKLEGEAISEFECIDGVWEISGMTATCMAEPIWYNEVGDEVLVEMLAEIIPEQCKQRLNISNIIITERKKTENGLTLLAEYQSEEGNILYTNRIAVKCEESILEGYRFSSLVNEQIVSTGLKEEIHKVMEGEYKLQCSGTRPNDVPASGKVKMYLDIDKNCNARLTTNIGALDLAFSGKVEYPDETLILKSVQKTVSVEYTLLFTTNYGISFSVYPSFRYQEDTLNGTIRFDTSAVGVDDFSIIIN